MMLRVCTPVLDVSYRDTGPSDAPAVVLLHGFPYSFHCYDDVVPILVHAGLRVIVPELRGYGGTRFLDATTMRSGASRPRSVTIFSICSTP